MKSRQPSTNRVLATLVLLLSSCGTTTGNPLVEDSSASGAVAGAVGGALSGSGSGGTLTLLGMPRAATFFARTRSDLSFFPDAVASSICPTFQTAQGAGCAASGGTMWLSYNDCSFGGGNSDWTGTQAVTSSSGAVSCGSFPNPGAGGSLSRQYVASAGSSVPSSATVTTAFGTEGVIDDHSANLKNFDGDSIATFMGSGYGSKVSFDSTGARNSLILGHRVFVIGSFDHTVTGTISITEGAGASSRVIGGTGSVSVYHNFLQVIGTSTFNDVIHKDSCCLPISGSITTVFKAGPNVQPTAQGALALGKSETLTFTGCGTATLQAYDGSTQDVKLTRCF